MRISHYTFKAHGNTYDFRHTQGSYGHLYEVTSQPANLVYADKMLNNRPAPGDFDKWVIEQLTHLLSA